MLLTKSNQESASAESGTPESRRGPSLPALLTLFVACMFFAGSATYWYDHRPEQVGAVDVGFFDDMTTHHNQALSIASTYSHYGTDTLFRSDAFKIIFSQSGDIRQMQRALQAWNRTGTPNIAMEWMGMRTPQGAQPGMATPQELAALNNARGRQLDDLFSALMINHHAGGIHMAQYAETHAKTKLARTMAHIMARDQRFEIIDFNAWRVHLGLPRHEPGQPVALPA